MEDKKQSAKTLNHVISKNISGGYGTAYGIPCHLTSQERNFLLERGIRAELNDNVEKIEYIDAYGIRIPSRDVCEILEKGGFRNSEEF